MVTPSWRRDQRVNAWHRASRMAGRPAGSLLWVIDQRPSVFDGQGKVKGGRDGRRREPRALGRRRRLARARPGARVLSRPSPASVGAAALVRAAAPAGRRGLGTPGLPARVWSPSRTVVLLVVDRLARRALPLATLLDLSMLFPDGAPSRLRVARAAIKRAPIEEQLARVARGRCRPGRRRPRDPHAGGGAERPRPADPRARRAGADVHRPAGRGAEDPASGTVTCCGGPRSCTTSASCGSRRPCSTSPASPPPDEWDAAQAPTRRTAPTSPGALLPWLGEWGDGDRRSTTSGTTAPATRPAWPGAQISLGARIVSVADAYDVMTAARAYKRPVSRAAAYRELVRFSGSQFDPIVVRAMLSVGAPRLRRAQGAAGLAVRHPAGGHRVGAGRDRRPGGRGRCARDRGGRRRRDAGRRRGARHLRRTRRCSDVADRARTGRSPPRDRRRQPARRDRRPRRANAWPSSPGRAPRRTRAARGPARRPGRRRRRGHDDPAPRPAGVRRHPPTTRSGSDAAPERGQHRAATPSATTRRAPSTTWSRTRSGR